MKWIALFLMIFVLGCEESRESKAEKAEKKLAELIEKEMGSEEVNNEIFLGFELGMTLDEYLAHMKKLIKEGKVVEDNIRDVYYHKMKIEGVQGDVEVKWNREFYKKGDWSLYKMIVGFKTPVYYDTGMLFLNIESMYEKKYTNIFNRVTIPDTFDPPYWDSYRVHGNRKIRISKGLGDVRVIYTDTRLEKLQEELEKSETEKSLDDI